MNPPPPSHSALLFCSPFFFPLPHISLYCPPRYPSSRFLSHSYFARNYPARNFPFLTHYLSLFLLLSFSLFLFPVLFLSLPFFVFISCLFTHHQHLFFMGINVPSFPQLLTIIHNVIYSLFANSFSNWLFLP
ncbi:hypothetical protein K457DRAFT_209954 [Linnemannia elongata AG-77]|uniref:Uncharacterized protein n=1 Tax=Linnemannia elongata AG-77 TaxID=1314771 RepID=A0A197JE73_9FUNG|nr:hypothetical protein K457DRAFT_209954 [Linnemannia elongata AG-77]